MTAAVIPYSFPKHQSEFETDPFSVFKYVQESQASTESWMNLTNKTDVAEHALKAFE